MDEIRNEYIRGTAQVGRFVEKTRGKTEVIWTCMEEIGWVHWEKDAEDGTARKEEIRRGRPKRRFMDAVREDMAVVEVTEEDTEDRTEWRWRVHCGNP